jgi:hypothetical protein
MLARIYRITKRLVLLLLVVAVVFLVARIYVTQRGASLAIWHTYVPHEMKAAELDTADWNRYLAEEAKIFETLRTEASLDALLRVASNPFLSYMLGRIEESIDGKTVAKKQVSPEPPSNPEAADKGASWTVKDALELILGPPPEQGEPEP